ncbi:SKP1-like protein 1B-like protein [Carex littledalei]|uniref:SKP1-like protein n=1 Tax=Carex littledalei TaxID=544730 RepID=A0A833R2M2_9POAL|nr:SKP1-like protein 1B-like protein [Carex littledalei]
MSDSTTSKMIRLKSSEGVVFVVPETVVMQSKTICHVIEDFSTITFIPLPNVRAPTLAMVIEYCKKHVEAADASKTEMTEDGSRPMPASTRISDKELRNWDMKFVDVDKDMLYDLIMAADYLHIEGLLDAACQKVADMITGKNPEMIRQIFNIKNDFTPKEEEEIRCENLWAFE